MRLEGPSLKSTDFGTQSTLFIAIASASADDRHQNCVCFRRNTCFRREAKMPSSHRWMVFSFGSHVHCVVDMSVSKINREQRYYSNGKTVCFFLCRVERHHVLNKNISQVNEPLISLERDVACCSTLWDYVYIVQSVHRVERTGHPWMLCDACVWKWKIHFWQKS